MESQNAASTLLIYDGTEIKLTKNIDDASATMTIFFSIDVPENAYLNLTMNDVVTNGEITGDSASFTVDLNQPVDIAVDHFYPTMWELRTLNCSIQMLS